MFAEDLDVNKVLKEAAKDVQGATDNVQKFVTGLDAVNPADLLTADLLTDGQRAAEKVTQALDSAGNDVADSISRLRLVDQETLRAHLGRCWKATQEFAVSLVEYAKNPANGASNIKATGNALLDSLKQLGKSLSKAAKNLLDVAKEQGKAFVPAMETAFNSAKKAVESAVEQIQNRIRPNH